MNRRDFLKCSIASAAIPVLSVPETSASAEWAPESEHVFIHRGNEVIRLSKFDVIRLDGVVFVHEGNRVLAMPSHQPTIELPLGLHVENEPLHNGVIQVPKAAR